MSDETLDKLGDYFVNLNIHDRYGITFQEFCRKVSEGTWLAYLAD